MPWVRLDDGFPDHRKLAELGPWAPLCGWLYVCGLAYANRQLTDGRIPWGYLPQLASFRGIGLGRLKTVTVELLAERLIEVGLWERPGPLHIQIHDYDQYQPTRAAIEAERLQKAEAGRQGGIAAAIAKATARATAPATASAQAGALAESKPVPKYVPKSDPKPDRREGALGKGSGETKPARAPSLTARDTSGAWKRFSKTKDAPGFAQLCALVKAERVRYPDEDRVSFVEHCKVICARAGLVYDGAHLAAALDAVEHAAARDPETDPDTDPNTDPNTDPQIDPEDAA